MNERTHRRLDLAIEQLDDAITLFLDRRLFASAITLAGAAEEIFGKELSRRGQEHVLDWKFSQLSICHRLLHGKELLKKSFFDEENRVRNCLKHFGETDPIFTADLETPAVWMIVRSMENARRLEFEIERFVDFDNWFYEHVVGI